MSKSLFKYLEPEDIRKLDSYEFAPKHIVEGYLAGRHKAAFRGLSTEFMDYRQYAQGDDPALLDWHVYARTDRYYIKTFEQETNTVCYILLDSSASMGFGSPISKLEYSSFFAAALCYLVIKGSNLVSLQLFDDKIRNFYEPGSTHSHLQNMMHVLEHNEAGNQTNLSESLLRAFPLMKRRGSLIIISDFFDNPGAIFAALNPYLHRNFKVYLFHILSPAELDLEPTSLTRFIDMENNSRITVNPENIRKRYQLEIQNHIERLRQLAVRRQVDYTLARTDTHYFKLFDRLVK